MQILYLVTFALILISLSTFGVREDNEAVVLEARAIAAQMSMHHQAAVDRCLKGPACGSGPVDGKDYLHPMVAAGQLGKKNLFTTNYDAGSKTILTYMNKGYAVRGSVTFGTVVSALRDLQPGESSTVGKWDRSSGRVVPSYAKGYQVSYSIPATFRSIVPDGSPVFVNHL